MIRVTVECIPEGLKGFEVAKIDIVNNRTNVKYPEMGNYEIDVTKFNRLREEVTISNHHREHGISPLLKKIFNKIKI